MEGGSLDGQSEAGHRVFFTSSEPMTGTGRLGYPDAPDRTGGPQTASMSPERQPTTDPPPD